MNGFFRHTGALRITKAEENKGTLGQAQTGAFPGDKCLSQLERRHTSGEYGKIYSDRERMRFKRQTPIQRLQGERLGKEKRHRKEERRESERNICDYRRKAGRIKRKFKKGDKNGERET